jgi:ABC-type Fe3+ transport system permease subunit
MQVFDGPYLGAVRRSLVLMSYVLGLALALGLPLGVLAGTCQFPWKTASFTCLAVPLFTPTFLWAVGISSLRPFFSYRNQQWFDGLPGSVMTCVMQVVPLVVFTAVAAVRTLTASQMDSVRIASGTWGQLRLASRYAFAPSLGAAVLGVLMTLTDPGTGQIMGDHGLASEILIAFAAKHDPALAARKAIGMVLVLSPLIGWLSWTLASWAERQVLGRDLRRADAIRFGAMRWVLTAGFLFCAAGLSFPALVGLARPLQLQATQHLTGAWNVLRESSGVTVLYGLGAGCVSACLGLAAGWAAAPVPRLRRAVLTVSFVLATLPAALTALGILVISAGLPASFDPVTRSGLMVGITQGIRFAPLAAVLCLLAACRLPQAQRDAGTLHGVVMSHWMFRVALPHMATILIVCVLLAASLSLAEVSTTLLLQPPGQASSFPARIFSVLDNVSERALAALCVVYVLAGAILLSLFFIVSRLAIGWQRR